MSFPQSYHGFKAEYHLLEWVAPDVLHVSFARSPVNALIDALWRETHRIFNHLHRDNNVRVIILTGQGRCFTAGLDLGAATFPEEGSDVARKAIVMREFLLEFQNAISSIENCEKPVIAATHSHCVGGGISILTACDVRYAASNTMFNLKEVDIGLAADIGALQRLPKVIGSESIARELAFTARNFDAKEALDIGLVSKVVPGSYNEVLGAYYSWGCDGLKNGKVTRRLTWKLTTSDLHKAEATKLGSVIASKSPVAIRSTKMFMVHARDHTVDEGLKYTALWHGAMFQSEDIPAAIMAGMQKQKPTFSKL